MSSKSQGARETSPITTEAQQEMPQAANLFRVGQELELEKSRANFKECESSKAELTEELNETRNDLKECVENCQQIRIQLTSGLQEPPQAEITTLLQQLPDDNDKFKKNLDKKNQELDKKNQELDKKNQELAKQIKAADADRQLLRETVIESQRWTVPVEKMQLLILLEQYRDHLAQKYELNFSGGQINSQLSTLLRRPDLDPGEDELIRMVMSGPGSLYSRISDQVIHASTYC